ncbi:C40 family peptidase [Mesobacillus foraminis]|uniref:NlpC/P60 family protein n=1 Tax=Mesobacillus foraminis TaxID=279826 RepID=UPI001BEBBA86|nr:NlpC/P60 family protein [Mesobacillus foraminis]MBT2759208.1 C40 family peptidase [Mesobacillus foraminis]
MNKNFDEYIHNAIKWAKGHLNSKDYCFICLAFVEDALERSNNIEIFGGNTAKESADLYGAYKHSGMPPKGTFVFYDCIGEINGVRKNWGHVGLSIGNGEVIHAWDKVRIDPYLEVEMLTAAPGWEKPKLIGWVPLERIMLGFQKKIY